MAKRFDFYSSRKGNPWYLIIETNTGNQYLLELSEFNKEDSDFFIKDDSKIAKCPFHGGETILEGLIKFRDSINELIENDSKASNTTNTWTDG